MHFRIIKLKLVLITVILILQGCGEAYENAKFAWAKNHFGEMHIIVYKIGEGALVTSTYYHFITDMKSFVKYVGKCDEKERLCVYTDNDSTFYVEFYSNALNDTPDETYVYNIIKLKSEGKFDKSLDEIRKYYNPQLVH